MRCSRTPPFFWVQETFYILLEDGEVEATGVFIGCIAIFATRISPLFITFPSHSWTWSGRSFHRRLVDGKKGLGH